MPSARGGEPCCGGRATLHSSQLRPDFSEVFSMLNRYTIAALFVIGTALGCWGEFAPPPSAWFGAFVYPGIYLSLFLGIGPHGPVRLFEWAFPLCNGIFYAGIASLALWLRTKISTRGSTESSKIR